MLHGSKNGIRQHNITPALPICHFVINAPKPKHFGYPIELKTIGDRLMARRMDLGLYQKDVAALLGVTEDTVCYWENGRVKPSPGMEEGISKFLCNDRA
jgi:DNA-binding XRE family transcriptional regulator